MKGNDDVIGLLNDVLKAELTAVNQYFVDAKMFTNWGLDRLASRFRAESIDEMKDADALIERILYLDGMPNVQRLGSVRIGESAGREAGCCARAGTRGDRPAQPGRRRSASSRETTARVSCSRPSSKARKTTLTGSKRSSS